LGAADGGAPTPGVAFEEAGGDSLAIMEMVFVLERAMGVRLPLERFHGGLTAVEFVEEAQACALAVRAAAPGQQPLIFLCPASHGDSPYLAEFRRRCGDGVRLVTVDYPDWRGCVAVGFGLGSLVDAVCAEVKVQAPAGPVRLAGFSMGGMVAYEAAVALEAAGREVSFLGILDAAAPGARGPEMAPEGAPPDRLRAWWWTIDQLRAARREHKLTRRLGRLAAAPCTVSRAAPLLRVIAGRAARVTTRPDLASLGDWTGYYLAELLRIAACRRAIPYDRRGEAKLRAPTVLFQCAAPHSDAAPDFGWSLVVEDLTIVAVPGNHFSVMTQPHVASTAALFVAAQAEVERRGRGDNQWLDKAKGAEFAAEGFGEAVRG